MTGTDLDGEAGAELYDLADWLEETWTIPYKGKRYQAPAPSAELGLRIEAIFALGDAAAEQRRLAEQAQAAGKKPPAPKELPGKYQRLLDDEAERDLYQEVLGPAWDELVDAAMPWPLLKEVAIGAMIRWHMGEEAADAHMRSLVSRGKAAPPNRASRRAASKTTAAARTTRKPASGSGTRPRRTS